MSGNQTTYEVHVTKTGSWSTDEIFYDEEQAKNRVRELIATKKARGAKVMRMSFREADGTFHEREVFYKGDEFAPAAKGGGAGAGRRTAPAEPNTILPICKQFTDFFQPQACRAISRLLSDSLDRWEITTTELLFSEENLRRLSDTGTILQAAVQRAAIEQIRDTRQEVSERVRELYDLVSDLRNALRAERDQEDVPILDDDSDLDAVVMSIGDESRRQRVLTIALCRYFVKTKKRHDKLLKLLKYLETSKSEIVIRVLDGMLSDYFQVAGTTEFLLGEKTCLGDSIMKSIAFAQGELTGDQFAVPAAKIMNDRLASHKLPRVRDGILANVRRAIDGSAAFHPDDKMENLMYHGRIRDALFPPGKEPVTDESILDQLAERCSRTVSTHTIGVLLEGANGPLEKMDRLLTVSPELIGKANRRTMGKQVISIIETPASLEAVVSSTMPSKMRLTKLSELQRKAEAAKFEQFQLDKILIPLDNMSMKIMEESNFFEEVRQNSGDIVNRMQTLLTMLIEGSMTTPSAKKALRFEISDVLKSPAFSLALEKLAEKGEQGKFMQMAFHKMLKEAGYE